MRFSGIGISASFFSIGYTDMLLQEKNASISNNDTRIGTPLLNRDHVLHVCCGSPQRVIGADTLSFNAKVDLVNF